MARSDRGNNQEVISDGARKAVAAQDVADSENPQSLSTHFTCCQGSYRQVWHLHLRSGRAFANSVQNRKPAAAPSLGPSYSRAAALTSRSKSSAERTYFLSSTTVTGVITARASSSGSRRRRWVPRARVWLGWWLRGFTRRSGGFVAGFGVMGPHFTSTLTHPSRQPYLPGSRHRWSMKIWSIS